MSLPCFLQRRQIPLLSYRLTLKMRSAEKEEEDPGVEAVVEEIDQEIVTDDEDHGPDTRKVKESEDIQVIATVTGA